MSQNDDAYALARLASNVLPTGTIQSTALPPSGNHNHAGAYSDPGHTHAASGGHPDLATHTGLGLAAIHSHPYAATSHAHVDGDLPASIARDTEVTAAVSAHEAAGNPHAGYATDADLTNHAAGPHGGGAWTTVIKTADESHNSSNVVADDALLKFTTTPNTNYVIRIRAFFLTNATADCKYRLTHAGTTTRVRRRVKRTATTDIAQTIALLTAFDGADIVLSTTGLNPWLEEDIVLQVGASGGLLVLRWGQVTSNAGPTTCLEGSYLEYAVT